jgi:VWFA-related protein
MFFQRCFWSVVLLCSIPFLYSQTAPAPAISTPTFKAKVQAVVVDLTVTDGNGSPIMGLKKDDFEISEDGEPQVVTSFEEHGGGPAAAPMERASLPANTYTNAPLVDPSGSVNVLLLDALNTPPADQMVVRQQMIKYLKTIDPGPRLAIFTLGEKLRMVEGFTSDPQQLLGALNHKDWGGMPQTPHLQTSADEVALEQHGLAQMADVPGALGAIQSLQNFLSETRSAETTLRMSVTLQVLQTLARYLSAFPGRKNLIWFSGSFPHIDFPSTRERMQLKSGDIGSGGDESGLGPEIKKTLNLLATAQVAVYTIAAQGVETDALLQASSLTPQAIDGGPGMGPGSAKVVQGLNENKVNEDTARNLNQNAADEITINTGGQAIYNTNGFKEAFADAVHRGSYYYRFSYSPSNKRTQGRYRHIRVKVLKGRYKLAYRRGYFEDTEKEAHANEQEPTDPLTPLMVRGMPNSTQIIYTLKVVPSNTPPTARGIAGDNKELPGPLARFNVDFVVPVNNLDFEVAPDEVRHSHVRLSILIYDHDGRPLNWEERSLQMVLKPKMLPVVQNTGVQFHFDIDTPPGDLYMRTGIYDFGSNYAGTLEIPLTVDKSEAALP